MQKRSAEIALIYIYITEKTLILTQNHISCGGISTHIFIVRHSRLTSTLTYNSKPSHDSLEYLHQTEPFHEFIQTSQILN